jgi:hypothetical protein
MFGWKDPLLHPPLISFAELLHNRRRQIVVEQRVHNGTMYNAVVYNYFEIGSDLSLTRILAFEQRAYAIGAREGLIVRTLERAGPNRLRLASVLKLDAPPHRQQDLGFAILESSGPGVPFEVKQRHPNSGGSAAILVTYSGELGSSNDDAFLREGYTFHYRRDTQDSDSLDDPLTSGRSAAWKSMQLSALRKAERFAIADQNCI